MAFEFEKGTPIKSGGGSFDFSKGKTVTPTTEQPSGGFFSNLVRGITKPVVTSIARPIQLAAELGGRAVGIENPDVSVRLPFFGQIDEPGAGARAGETLGQTLKKEIGTGLQTVALGMGPVTGGAAFAAGSTLEEGGGLGEAAISGAIGAATGKVASKALTYAGKGIGAVGSKLTQPFRSSVARGVVEAASRRGVTLPLSAQTESRFLRSAEGVVRTGYFGKGVEDTVNKARNQLLEIVSNLRKTVNTSNLQGSISDPISLGNSILEDLTKAQRVGVSMKNELYSKIPNISAIPAEVARPVATLNEIIARKSQSADPGAKTQIKFYQSILDSLTDPNKKVTFENLKQTRSDIFARTKNKTDLIATGDLANLKKVQNSLSDAMDETAKKYSKEAAEALSAANTYNAELMKEFSSKIAQQISKSEKPELLINQIIRPNDISTIQFIKRNITPETLTDIQSVFIGDLLDKATDLKSGNIIGDVIRKELNRYGDDVIKELLTPSQVARLNEVANAAILNDIISSVTERGVVSPKKIVDAITEYGGEEKLAQMVGKDVVDQLKDVSLLQQALSAGTKAGEGSPTTPLARIIGSLAALTGGGVGRLLRYIGGEKALERLVTTPFGKKLLTEGFGEIRPLTRVGSALETFNYRKTVGDADVGAMVKKAAERIKKARTQPSLSK